MHGGGFAGTVLAFVPEDMKPGKGIGKKLWFSLKKYLEEKNVSKVYLYSGNECNFGFYESQGFIMRRKKNMCVVFDGEEDRTEQYLYEYMIQKSGDRQ